jgi:hypothetical protein
MCTTVQYGKTNASDVAVVGNYAYVLDPVNKCIYRSNVTNSPSVKSKTLQAANGGKLNGPVGLTISGDTLWVLDSKSGIVYRYSLAAVFNGGGTIKALTKISLASANSKGESIWNDAGYLYVLDNGTTKTIYRYAKSGGSPVKSRTLLSHTGVALNTVTGFTNSYNYFYLVDKVTARAYSFAAATLFSGTGTQNAASMYLLNSVNLDATGIALATNTGLLRTTNHDFQEAEPRLEARIFPNPTTGDVTLRYSQQSSGTAKAVVYSMTGQLLMARESNQQDGGTYDLALPLKELSLPPGIYLVRLECEGRQEVMRLVMEQ